MQEEPAKLLPLQWHVPVLQTSTSTQGLILKDAFPEYTGGMVSLGYGIPPRPDFWIGEGTPNEPSVHIAFHAETRKQVDDFYKAALAAGGKDNGPPGPRPHYHKDFYGAFVLDPDGHNIEAVCRTPA